MDLRVIDKRLSRLEQRVGVTDLSTEDKTERQNVVETLVNANNKVSTIFKDREKCKEAMKQLSDMPTYLDPTLADQMTASNDAKLKIIDLLWPVVEERIEQFRKLQTLLPVLDSEHIKNTPSLSGKLAPIGSKQLDQIENIRGHTKDVSELIKLYNELIMMINKQFVYWDKTLSDYECKHQMF